MNSKFCQCGKPLLRGWGSTSPEVLLLIGYPDKWDYRAGMVAAGRTQSFLKTEFTLAKIPQQKYRVEALWRHYMSTKTTPDDPCYQYMLNLAKIEMQKCKYVLLSGPEIASVFLEQPIATVNGLQITSSKLPQGPVFYGILSPSYGMSQTVGEFRLALKKLSERIRQDE